MIDSRPLPPTSANPLTSGTPTPPELSLSIIEHPFRPETRKTALIPLPAPVSLLDLRNGHFPADLPVVIYVNGLLVPEDEWADTFPRPRDFVVFTADLGYEWIAGAVAAIVTLISSSGSIFGGVLGALATLAIKIGAAVLISYVGGLIVGAFASSSSGDTSSSGDSALDSQAYTWSPQNTEQQGIPVAKWYGYHRVYGNIICSYIENVGMTQYINALICIGLGPIQGVGDFRLNDQPATNYKGTEIQVRPGFLDQIAIANFANTKTEYPTSVEIIYGSPYYYSTVGSDFDGLEIDLAFPNGLCQFYETTTTPQRLSVDMRIEVRKIGDSAWTNITEDPVTTNYTLAQYDKSNAQWSEGKLTQIGGVWYWWNIQGHPADAYLDHTEGATAVISGCVWHWMGPPPLEYWQDSIADYVETVFEDLSSEVTHWSRVLTGDTTDPWTFTFKYFAPAGATPGQHEIRVTRVVPNYNLNTIRDQCYLTSVREVITDAFQYPRHALVGVRVLASDQISGSFRFSCTGKHSIVRVWNGFSWTIEWSDNPAWIAFDIFTQPVIAGEGTVGSPWTVIRFDGYDPGVLDLAKFKEWADYCSEIVPDGTGGYETRITFNGGFDFDTTMWEAALRVCQVGRAVPIWNGTTISLAIDKPSDPVNLYTVGNIDESKFKEVFLPIEERATQIEIDYVNRDNSYQRDKLTVYRPDSASNQYKASLDLFGITKPTEVWRTGMYRLNCNKYLLRSAEIDVDLEALNAQIGDVVYIQHDVPAWGAGGRIVSAGVFDQTTAYSIGDRVRYANALYDCILDTTVPSAAPTDTDYWTPGPANEVELDKEVTIASGTYKLMLRLPEDVLYDMTVTSAAGAHTTITVTPAFDTGPDYDSADGYLVGDTVRFDGKIYVCTLNTGSPSPAPTNAEFWSLTGSCPLPENFDIYAFGLENTLVKQFRVTEISLSQDQKATLTLVEYREEIYDFEDLTPELNDYYYNLGPLAAPTDLQVEEVIWYEAGVSYSKAVFTWRKPNDSRVGKYHVYRSSTPAGREDFGTTYGTAYVFKTINPGVYTFHVRSETADGQASVVGSVTKEIYGKITPPSDVENLYVNVVGGMASLTWDAVTDEDLSFYIIRYSSVTSGATWEQATTLVNYLPKSTTMFTTPARVGTYMIKAGNGNGRTSTTAATSVTTLSAITGLSAAGSLTEAPPFTGAKTHVTIDDNGYLILAGQRLLSEVVVTTTELTDEYGDSIYSQLDDPVADEDDDPLTDEEGASVLGWLDDSMTATAGVGGLKNFASLDDELYSEGAYVLAGSLDCGSVDTYRIMATVVSTARDYLDKMGQWPSVSARASFSGGDLADVDVKSFVRRKSLIGDEWSGYTQFSAGDFLGRYFEFKIVLSAVESHTTPVVNSVTFDAYLPV